MRRAHRTVWIAAGLLALVGCGALSSDPQRLRITNRGAAPIAKLTVRFPEDRIGFDDVPAGATTSYRDVKDGVYGYAAYSLEIGGAIVTQPVIDWVGEEPMAGKAFTYTLELDPLGSSLQMVRLVSVTRDE